MKNNTPTPQLTNLFRDKVIVPFKVKNRRLLFAVYLRMKEEGKDFVDVSDWWKINTDRSNKAKHLTVLAYISYLEKGGLFNRIDEIDENGRLTGRCRWEETSDRKSVV